MRWLFFLYVRTDHDGGNKFLRRMQKILWGGDEAKTTRCFYKNWKRDDVNRFCKNWQMPHPGQRFSDKFLTTGTDKMINAGGGGGEGMPGIDWAISISQNLICFLLVRFLLSLGIFVSL